MRLAHLAARVYNAPLLIAPDKARLIEDMFRTYAAGEKAAPIDTAAPVIAAAATTGKPYALSAGGVAIIPVLGTLVQRASGMDALSGLTSYARLSAQIKAAVADPEVATMLLEIDSPGGEVYGLFDLAAQIRRAASQKRTVAFANEQAFSAAYAIAAAAGEIFTSRTGMVGSIGVVMMHVDQSQRDAKAGYTYTPIYAGAHKVDFSSHAPLTDTARATAQAEVDRLYGMFVAHVATARALEPLAVAGTEAALLSAEAALAAGLIDRIASFDDVLAELAASRSGPGALITLRGALSASSQVKKGPPMNENTTLAGDAAAQTPAPVAQPQASPVPAPDLAVLEAAARTAERARCRAILSADAAADRPALARTLALDTDLAPEAALTILAAAAAEKPVAAAGNALAAAMSTVPNPTVGVGDTEDQDTAQTEARRIVALFDQSRGRAA
jgi:signal peptide peptidase SppA